VLLKSYISDRAHKVVIKDVQNFEKNTARKYISKLKNVTLLKHEAKK
jgi:hypothetical protein